MTASSDEMPPRRPRRRIAVRLVLIVGAATLAAVALFWGATQVIVSHELHASLDAALRQRAVEVAELAVSDPAVLGRAGALETGSSGRAVAVEVLDARGRILARSAALTTVLLPADRLVRGVLSRGRAGYENLTLQRRAYRIYAAPIPDAAGPASGGAVIVASPTGDIGTTLRRIGLVLALAGLAVALVAVAAAAGLATRATGPLRRLVRAASEIERTADAGRRLPQSRRADEIGELVQVLNRMLEALERAREGERRFLADASHELRTPVASLIGNVDYITRHGADEAVLEDLAADAARLARLVDDLLILERSRRRDPAATAVDLTRLLLEAVDARQDAGIEVLQAEGVTVIGNDLALRRAIDNLLDNARVHGPEGGRVRVALVRRDGSCRLTVSDEGPGPAAEERAHLFERFWRGGRAAARPGAGLGLSIVAGVAQAHGGYVEVDRSAFTIVLPGRPDGQDEGNSHVALSEI